MQVETKQVEAQQTNPQGIIDCPNCHAILPQEMLFCRMCGTRLVEGSVTEATTVRFGQQPATFNQANPAAQWQAKKRRGPHWIVWMILGIVIASFAGGALFRPLGSGMFKAGEKRGAVAPQSKIGVEDITSIENNGGAMIDAIKTPDSPVDKAGMIGGDIIKSFDGKQIKDEDDLRSAIRSTPVGKTVEVIYTRDGETKKTNLTTVNEDELDRLNDIFDEKPKGQLGVEDLERVPVPNTNIYGVRIGNVQTNRAAYFADMKDGDIVVEFNGTPIRTREEMFQRIQRAVPRSEVKVVIYREGQKMDLKIKIGER